MNTPPPNGGGFELRLKAGLVRLRQTRSGHVEVVVRSGSRMAPHVLNHTSSITFPLLAAYQMYSAHRWRGVLTVLGLLGLFVAPSVALVLASIIS